MNASIFFKSRRRPIRLDQVDTRCRVAPSLASAARALETAALPPGIFCANKALEKLAFGNSIVLRTRRSTLALVYV